MEQRHSVLRHNQEHDEMQIGIMIHRVEEIEVHEDQMAAIREKAKRVRRKR